MSDQIDIREQLVRMFGDDAPAQPRTAAEFDALSATMRESIRSNCPKYYQDLKGDPGQLPAAVSLRRERGELTGLDIEALAKANLDAEARELQRTVQENALKALNNSHSDWAAQQEEKIKREREMMEQSRKASIRQAQASIAPKF